MIFLLLFSLLQGVYSSPEPFVLHLEPHCVPCSVIGPSPVLKLPPSRPPCYHPGQALFQWPSSNACPLPVEFHSRELSVDEVEGWVLAKERLCFYDSALFVSYSFRCSPSDPLHSSSLRIEHSTFSTRRRFKRWLRRRNPNMSAIHFLQDRYVKEVPESLAVGSLVLSVSASHASNAGIFYSLAAPEDARSQNLFALDTQSGEIRLAKALDREILAKHVLKVTAYERLDPTVAASTTVVIEVIDVQDNSPVFERDSYFAEIREDAPVGTTVLSVFARDLDEGENGRVEYSLGEGTGRELLSIHPSSGVIQTAAVLDRETLSLLRLSVIATDKGDPPFSSSALIEINIVDVNDNAPQFEYDAYNVTVLENCTLPAVIARIHAVDADVGVNGEVHYSLVTSTTSALSIDYSTGEVTLRQRLDARLSPLSLLVRAKDSAQPALSSTVSLTIHVVDINDHAPTFIASQKQIFLEENVAVGEEVSRVYAIDEDSGENGRVRYRLEGNLTDFNINPDSGIIRTSAHLDREHTSKYTLKIVAEDGGSPPLSSTSEVEVIVKDVNDNSPTFPHSLYNVSLSEETPRGSQIITLKAEDKDEEQRMSYRLEHVDRDVVALIDLGEQGALLSLSGQLKSSDEMIRVEVVATDQGGQQGRCTVLIKVEDVNQAPVFVSQPFTVRIPEDSPVGFHVLTMKAEDRDRGANARLHFFVESEKFAINEHTGLLTVATPLDREQQSSHSLLVTVSDSAEPPLNSSTLLEVILDDVNDNAPVFSSLNYTASISEDTAVGTSFLQVAAEDADAGPNGVVDFFLNESSPSARLDLFRLDRTSGTLRVNAKLDRELMETIALPIYARDRGSPSLYSSSLITITLEDVNDNAPRFSSPSYDLWIAENSPLGSIAGVLVATDPDAGDNAKIQYRIFGGADAKLFELETDSEDPGAVRLLTRAVFDYEAKTNKFYVEVQASSGQLSSTVGVRVHVSDVNDNPPQLRDFVMLVVHFEGDNFQREIGSIPAFDPDQNATLEFSLEHNDLLVVDRFTGRLSLKALWKRSLRTRLKTCVSDGPNTVCATCELILVHVESWDLREATTIRLEGTRVDDLLDVDAFGRLTQSLSTLAPSWRPDDIRVLSIQADNSSTNVSFVVSDRGRLVKAWKVGELLTAGRASISQLSLFDIRLVAEEGCRAEPCPYFQKCRHALKYVKDVQVQQTDNFVARTIRTLRTFACECPVGFTSSEDLPGQCDLRLDQCYSNPCEHNGTCVPLESGYHCECPEGWKGRSCEVPERALTCIPGECWSESRCELQRERISCSHCPLASHDTDGRCRLRSVSFHGQGLVRVPHNPGRIEWSLEFSVATIASKGTLVFAGHRDSDFLEIFIENRLLRAEFSLGGKSKLFRLSDSPRNRVNNGQWRKIRVDFFERRMTVVLDDCDVVVALNGGPWSAGEAACAVRGEMELPNKCLDPTVPCLRFLDLEHGLVFGGRPASGQHSKVENGFSGCISNVSLDGELIHFSDWEALDRVGSVFKGCHEMADHCLRKGCPRTSKCVNRWKGRVCECPHLVHTKKECSADAPGAVVSLLEEESFVAFESPSSPLSLPFTLSLEFRSRRQSTQVLAVEFSRRSHFVVVSVEDGDLEVNMGGGETSLTVPLHQPGSWTSLSLTFNSSELSTTVDHIHTTKLPISLWSSDSLVHITTVFSGLAPSTSHPSRFEGCLRNVAINHRYLDVFEQNKVRDGCVSTNRCNLDDVCPVNSRCIREWHTHRCECHPGFVGDTCHDVCAVKGICGRGGVCMRSNSSRGYECSCASGFWGRNCELRESTRRCPFGWWGAFPHCKQCLCDQRKGFVSQCHRDTGACLCDKTSFVSGGRCVPCECGFGAKSTECDNRGRCACRGQAKGRRCDRCANDREVLDPKELTCSTVNHRCPAQIEGGVQWPTTIAGAQARQSCPRGEVGLATRTCSRDSRWAEVNSFNCTRHEYTQIIAKLSPFDASVVAAAVQNATRDPMTLRGRNLDIARSALHRILDESHPNSLRGGGDTSRHLSDESFSHTLVQATAALLYSESPDNYLKLAGSLADYGSEVWRTHVELSFLEPFQVSDEHILFVVDRLDSTRAELPKFDRVVDRRPSSFPQVEVSLVEVRSPPVFLQILPRPHCPRCDSPLVSVAANTTEGILVRFPLREEFSSGWRFPECVRLSSSDDWTTGGATLVGLNSSHAVCEFERPGTFTILSKVDQGVILRFTRASTLPYFSPLCTLFSLLLSALSLLSTLSRCSVRTRLVRVGVIIAFAFDVLALFAVHRVSINSMFCPARNTLLSLCITSLFAWLFLYSLHIYRLLAEGTARSNVTVCLLLGVVLPVLLSSSAFVFAVSCSLAPSGWLFWFLSIPAGLLLLLSFYGSATSLLISMHKQYDVLVVKFALRKALAQHALLTLLCVLANVFGLFLRPLFSSVSPANELVSDALVVFAAVYLFIWSTFFEKTKSSQSSAAGMWLSEDQQRSVMVAREDEADNQRAQHSPLLGATHVPDGGDDWMGDVIPADPYLHSVRERENPLTPKILSPAAKILMHQGNTAQIYGSREAVPDVEEDKDVAYYSYTAMRRYKSSTFNRI